MGPKFKTKVGHSLRRPRGQLDDAAMQQQAGHEQPLLLTEADLRKAFWKVDGSGSGRVGRAGSGRAGRA